MIPHKQLSLEDVFEDCRNIFEYGKPRLLSLLEQHVDMDEIIPSSFWSHFRASTGRTRKYPLPALMKALILQKVLSIPTDTLLLVFLKYSRELRDFCGFIKVPDASKITRFKQDFLPDIRSVFERLVDITEPICQAIDSELADIAIFDTSGIEAWVTENNPKYTDRIVRQLKVWAKVKGLGEAFDPYKVAYGCMPPHAAANPEVKQNYTNGHFCYAYKFGIVSNGLGVPRHIMFYNKDFYNSHPELVLEKKSDSPDEDKSAYDSRLLVPTLADFFKTHPLINPKTFLGDAAFDSVQIYKDLLCGGAFGADPYGNSRKFLKAYIPLNQRSGLENVNYTINEDGIPCCPNDPDLPMKPEGTSKLKSGVVRYKFTCPKVKWVKNRETGK